MLIAIDLDEVLAETMPGVISFHNQKYGTTLSIDNFHSYKWHEVWGGTKKEAVEKFFLFTKSVHFKNLKPLKEAMTAINVLTKTNELIVLSSRQKEFEGESKRWIEKYFPNKFKAVYIINHADWAKGGKTMTKKEMCQKLGVEVLIEDNLDYANECASINTTVFLLNYPWNKGEIVKGVIRVNSWREIVSDPILKGKDVF